MLMLKLQRSGKKGQAYFRLVVGERRSKLNGKQLEDLGWFDPHKDANGFNKERVLYWLSKGVQTTPTVNNLLVSAGVVMGKKIAKGKTSKKTAATAEQSNVTASVTPSETPTEQPASAS